MSTDFSAVAANVALGLANAPTTGVPVGTVYIVGSSPTGAFAGEANNIAYLEVFPSTWSFVAPQSMQEIFVQSPSPAVKMFWNGAAWQEGSSTPAIPFVLETSTGTGGNFQDGQLNAPGLTPRAGLDFNGAYASRRLLLTDVVDPSVTTDATVEAQDALLSAQLLALSSKPANLENLLQHSDVVLEGSRGFLFQSSPLVIPEFVRPDMRTMVVSFPSAPGPMGIHGTALPTRPQAVAWTTSISPPSSVARERGFRSSRIFRIGAARALASAPASRSANLGARHL
jgi:hypothetical protein